MKFSTSLPAALLSALSITAAATPTPAPESKLVQVDLSNLDLSNLDITNLTAVLSATNLSKRQDDYEWWIFHYTGHDCTETWINAWFGTGPSGCVVIPDGQKSRSHNFVRNYGNLGTRVTQNEHCGTPASFDDRTGCHNYPANINQGGVSSFEIV